MLFWLGVLLCIGSVVLGLALGGRTVDQLRTAVSDAVPMVDGTAAVQLVEGGQRGIYEVTVAESAMADCSVEAPDGTDVPVRRGEELGGSMGGTSYAYVGDFRAPQDGSYTVSCTGAQTVLGPSLDLGSLGGGVLSIVAGVAGFLLGAFLVLVGAVLWLIGRSQDRKRILAGRYPGQSSGHLPPPPSW